MVHSSLVMERLWLVMCGLVDGVFMVCEVVWGFTVVVAFVVSLESIVAVMGLFMLTVIAVAVVGHVRSFSLMTVDLVSVVSWVFTLVAIESISMVSWVFALVAIKSISVMS